MTQCCGREKRHYWFVWCAALALNTFSLFVPFVEVEKVLGGKHAYNLLRTVTLMWESGLQILAVIIVFFSVLFPFAKLSILASYLASIEPSVHQRRLLKWVERLGKWSTIDVFIVCFILALTNDQRFVDAEPRLGLYTFMSAIVLSLGLSNRLDAQDEASSRIGAKAYTYSLKAVWFTGSLLLLTSLAFAGLMSIPFIQIKDWLLKDHALTVVTFLWALFQQGAGPVACILALGILVLPAVDLGLMWYLWLMRFSRTAYVRMSRRLDGLGHWSLLDVFLVSLMIYLLEGQELMSFKAGWGLGLLIIAQMLYVVRFWARRRLLRRLKKEGAHQSLTLCGIF